MDRVFRHDERSIETIQELAIGIREVSGNQRHVGILYRDGDEGTVMMLDLQWHHVLRNDPADPDLFWVDPAVNLRRLAQVSAICRLIWKANQRGGIPYGFSSPENCFDPESGGFLLGPTRLGLTCATFILAVFHRAGVILANYDSWPVNRPGDREWQQKIIHVLEKYEGEEEHATAISRDVGAVRFRPEEVAGAAIAPSIPAEFEEAENLSKRILDRLREESRD